jgi:putative SOS response-associated peptidase YedK
MCGRFILGDASWAEYHDALRIIRGVTGHVSYNIKPTQTVALARIVNGSLTTDEARWWLVPDWFRGEIRDWKATTFNARIETAATKPVFRRAWSQGRCILPASGYYEWTGEKSARRPWVIGLTQNAPVFFFAGLCAAPANGGLSCTILTREAAPELRHLHPRMPVILTGDELMPWLSGEIGDDAATGLGTGWDGRYTSRPVRPFGRDDDGPELIDPDGFNL